MKIGIMQPYFIPYIDYWQLMSAVDKYVIYDDVNFIKGGWINRNRILVEGVPKFFNLPILGASSNKKINEITVNHNKYIIGKALRIIESAYKKAAYYEMVRPLIEKILYCKENNLAKYIGNSFKIICEYVNITTELIYSSELNKDNSLKGQEKVIAICNLLEATEYYNAWGGQKLYSYSDFEKYNIKLKFLKSNNIMYSQYNSKFQKNLSIIDVLMFNSKEQIYEMLKNYILLEKKEIY